MEPHILIYALNEFKAKFYKTNTHYILHLFFIGASVSEPHTSELILEFLYMYVSYIIPYIQTIYLAGCSLKMFAETILCYKKVCYGQKAIVCLTHTAVELCCGQRREVSSKERI